MQSSVTPIKDEVFDEKEKGDLQDHVGGRRQGFNRGRHADKIEERMGEDDYGEDEEEMVQKNAAGAVHLGFRGVRLIILHFPAAKVRDGIGDVERDEAAPVEYLVDDEGDDCFELEVCERFGG